MARSQKQKGKGKKGKTQKRPTTRQVAKYRGSLDAAARAYANLLRDPCNAPLVHGVLPGMSGGYVSRFVSEFTLGNASGLDALVFTPNCVTQTAANGYCSIAVPGSTITNSTTAFALTSYLPSQPGYNFLTNNTRSARCLAACLQFYYAGAAQSRSGYFGVVQSPAANFASSSLTIDAVKASCSIAGPITDGVTEIRWSPSQGDFETFTSADAAMSLGKWGEQTAIGLVLGGVPAASIRVRCVAVYEWEPAMMDGFGPAEMVPNTRNTISDVLNWLREDGKWWFKQGTRLLSYF